MLSDLGFRIRALIRRGTLEDDLDGELREHLARQIDAHVAAGMSPDEARRRAQIEFGGVEQIREECRDARGVSLVEDLWRDLCYAARVLRRQPAFTLVVILTLALGIGANTAIFQLLNAVQFRMLPVKDPGQLVEVRPRQTQRWGRVVGRHARITFAIFDQLRRNHEPFSGISAWGATRFDLSTSGESRLVDGLWVSGEFFDVLGVPAAAGRILTARDDVRGCGAPGIVISYAFWQREFGGAASAVGRAIHLDGHLFEIIGVTPAAFTGVDVGRGFDVAVPICAEPLVELDNAVDKPHYWWLDAIGRLKPGWTIERANTYLAAMSPSVFAATVGPTFTPFFVKTYLKMTLGARPAGTGVSSVRSEYQTPLWTLLALSGIVLTVACANLANLLLARATAREREIAIRLAIGASRSRVVRQLLAESLVLAAAGALLGVLLARWASGFLVALISTDGSPVFFDLRSDGRVLAFTCALAAGTCALFGLLPALRATRRKVAAAVQAGRRTSDSHEGFALRRFLVAAQVALSLVLVVGALLFSATMRNLATMDSGYRTDNVLVADFDVRGARVPTERQDAFQRDLLAHVAAVPGVEMTANAAIEPGTGNRWNDKIIVDGVLQQDFTFENHVSPQYFRLLGIPLITGRHFDERDVPGAPRVAIVSQALAERFLKTKMPIGRTFRLQVSPGEPDPVYQVIGLVADTKYADFHEPIGPMLYLPEAQDASPNSSEPFSEVLMLVRGRVPVTQLTASITAAARDVSPAVLVRYRTLAGDIQAGFLRERLMATLSGFFGALAALLATIGLYGVLSYTVARRRNEIGIRLALGADRRSVIGLVMRDAAVLVVVGLAVGVPLSLVATRSAQALLFGVTPWDPATLAGAALGLAAISAAASAAPALRASRLDPNVALREE